jgi:hypothetical protein
MSIKSLFGKSLCPYPIEGDSRWISSPLNTEVASIESLSANEYKQKTREKAFERSGGRIDKGVEPKVNSFCSIFISLQTDLGVL